MDYNKIAQNAMQDALQDIVANADDIFGKDIAPAFDAAKNNVLEQLKKDSEQPNTSYWIKIRYIVMSVIINAVCQIIQSICVNAFKSISDEKTNK